MEGGRSNEQATSSTNAQSSTSVDGTSGGSVHNVGHRASEESADGSLEPRPTRGGASSMCSEAEQSCRSEPVGHGQRSTAPKADGSSSSAQILTQESAAPGVWAANSLNTTVPGAARGAPAVPSTYASNAADMIRAASQAGLQSVSSCLATQAQTQVHAARAAVLGVSSASLTAAATSPGSNSTVPGTWQVHGIHPRRASTSAEYSAALNAHISSALLGVNRTSNAEGGGSPRSAVEGPAHDKGPYDMSRAQIQMAEIATKTAIEEAERQLRLRSLLRSADRNPGKASPHATGRRPSQAAPRPGEDAETSTNSRLAALGLEHIPLPSQGFEQSWGRADERIDDDRVDGRAASETPLRFYDAGDAFAGVPSLPLMPGPAPVMMDPQPDPTSLRMNLPYPGSSLFARKASEEERGDADAPTSSGPSRSQAMSLEVVQTPGGTAKAGYWVTEDSDVDVMAPKEPLKGSTASSTHVSKPLFIASYTFTSQTYSALATQAAYATSLLTSTITSRPQRSEHRRADLQDPNEPPGAGVQDKRSSESSTRWQPLEPTQQEVIAKQLCAWAGLQGPEKQVEAQRSLEQRQLLLAREADETPNGAAPDGVDYVNGAEPQPGDGSSRTSASADPTSLSQASAFFPPDFASHYRAQLQSLARGYYQQLHLDGLTKNFHAESRTSDAPPQGSTSNLSSGATPPLASSSLTGTGDRDPQNVTDGKQHQSDDVFKAAVDQRTRALGVPAESVAALISNAVPPTKPPTTEGAQDPAQLLTAASTAAGADPDSEVVLEQLLRFAHALYQTGNDTGRQVIDGSRLHPTLLPLLYALHEMHPTHLPTLLLLSCAYYSAGDLAASLYWNDRILTIDSRYVEAMSNIGTTLRSLGRWQEAESWWQKAIRLRPGYWDAFENLLGVLCASQQDDSATGKSGSTDQEQRQSQTAQHGPRWQEALRLCEHVEAHVLARRSGADGRVRKLPGGDDRPLHLPRHLSPSSVPRLQHLFYAKGNLKYALLGSGVPAAKDYMKAIELVISPSEHRAYSCRDLIMATCVAGLVSMGVLLPGSAIANAAIDVMRALAFDPSDAEVIQLATAGQWYQIVPGGLLQLVHSAGDTLVKTMLRLGGGQLPMVMLLPEPAMKITRHIFDEYNGQLPSLAAARSSHKEPASPKSVQQCLQTTSTIFLTLSKLFQDATANPASSEHGTLTLGGIPPSTSLLLPLYYLALALNPSASTCNNLGILLSGLPVVTTIVDEAGNPQTVNGQGMAMCYYQAGISMDGKHPHLYTNLGSLLKDLGHLKEAIENYSKAVALHPTFDVALANLGNSLRDSGRTEEALPYYRRALAANPTAQMPEAMCGLLNGLLSLSDWRDAFSNDPAKPGLLYQTAQLVEKQLTDGAQYGRGAIQAAGPITYWLQQIAVATGDRTEEDLAAWAKQLKPFYQPLDREALRINEGGFVIRLVEQLHKRSQRKWYRDNYGKEMTSTTGIEMPRIRPTQSDSARYPTVKLPAALVAPSVPTVLPFHTFSYGIEGVMSARALRLISHRNGIRISQTSLTQPWLPSHVYPPPPPPSPKIKVGYVSSDFNNHPLAHLMQSVFGFHDPARFEVYLYATTASDNSPYRRKIEAEAQHFRDLSAYSTAQIIDRILYDGIHILVNLNGYTKGARNEVFAARPCPVQAQFMGFAGGMASGWTDYTIADEIVCPPEVTSAELWKQRTAINASNTRRPTELPGELDPEEPSNEWMYTERFIYMPHSYFVNDHKQGFREPEFRRSDLHGGLIRPREVGAQELWAEEEERRWQARKELFPGLPDDYVIFATFNQIYKIEPAVFKAWLRILIAVPHSILWLLRFPAAGEANILRTAREWAGDEVCARIVFTDVAPKEEHIRRGRVADLFLDTFEVNAHTTACDCLWSGTPVLTLPKWKFKQASLVAASIARATGYGDQMIVKSIDDYVERAVSLARSVEYTYVDDQGGEVATTDRGGTVLASQVARVGASAELAAQAQARAATAGPDASCTTANGQMSVPNGDQQAVPAPVTVQEGVETGDASKLAAAEPPRDSILLSVGPQVPPTSRIILRRGMGELCELRRNLFLRRDSMPLFDTKGWVRDLERGYTEAWRRWSLGVDIEGSAEWKALGSDEARSRSSGHIYVRTL
ncbi:unnamed protein product [Parajaminaea phylloscopi]